MILAYHNEYTAPLENFPSIIFISYHNNIPSHL